MPALAEHFRVYALDMPGSGFSDCSPDLRGGLQAHAENLLEILDALGIESCDLLATSYGGGAAMLAAAMATSRFNRLVLVAPINPWSAHGRVIAPFLSNWLVAPLFSRIYPHLYRMQGRMLRRIFGISEKIPSDSLAGYAAPLRNPAVLKHALKTIHSWNADLRLIEQALPSIRGIPVLMIWGKQDKAVAFASAKPLSELFANCQLISLEGVGHLPYEEVPKQFAQAVIEFLR